MYSSELKYPKWRSNSNTYHLEDFRTLIYETDDNSMEMIQKAALCILAVNCVIITYWFGQYKPIFNDFWNNHGATIKIFENANGKRNGRPRTQSIFGISICGSDQFIGLNRFIILVSFLSKILIPFLDSITGKKQYAY